MLANSTRESLIAELYTIEGRAEIVDGEVVRYSYDSPQHNKAVGAVGVSLLRHGDQTKSGYCLFGTVAYIVDLPNRWAFCPDAAFYTSPRLSMKFPEGAPGFAVEIRNPWDYGEDFEAELRQKVADYFAAGTQVVWDVDLLGEDIVRVYRAGDPSNPATYRRGDTAEAEPAVPGWLMAVDDLFAS